MTSISLYLVESEEEIRTLIIGFVARSPALNLLGVAKNLSEVEDLLRREPYDVILYNPNFPGLGGLQFIKLLNSESAIPPLVVTIIERGESAVENLAAGAIDCLEMPISIEQFDGMIARLYQRLREYLAYRETLGSISVRSGGEIRHLKLQEIVYLSGEGKRTTIHTLSENLEVAALLKDTIATVQSRNFCRIHKRYVVNLTFFNRLRYDAGGRYKIGLKSDLNLELPVGAVFAQELRQRLGIRKISLQNEVKV